jgi:hypothetical protein
MNLKLLAPTKTLRVIGADEGLIASTAASAVAASSAIASGWVAWIARAVECGIIAGQPTGDDPALSRGVIAPVRQEVLTWRAAICAAVLQTCHQQVANQRCTAGRICECRHLACHGCLLGKIVAWRFIVHRKKRPGLQHLSPNLALSFIDRSSAVWNFRRRRTALSAVLPRFRKVTS